MDAATNDHGNAPATVAVLDVGKTNVKLSAVEAGGTVVETLSVPNPVLPGPPWRHHNLKSLSEWVLEMLAGLARRHPLGAFVTAGHGSGGVLTGADPDAGDGTVLPMIDYEQPLPAAVRDGYVPLAGSFLDRGSATMHAATHQARQLYWMQQREPRAFSQARWYLGLPQYWAWRLCGVAASETSFLGAQSHLWNVAERRWAPIVAHLGWERLMPPFAKAWQPLGAMRPELVRRFSLPEGLRVLTGGHDSSLNHYRYHAAGLQDFTVISTGTWIVGFSGSTPITRLDEHRGMTLNSDVFGNPLGGILTMGGREFSHIAGIDPPADDVPVEILKRLIAQQTMALPSFGDDDGLFPGSAGAGRILGPPVHTAMERKALALLYCALLTVECLEALGDDRLVVLDGSFLRDPLYAAVVAALLPGRRVRFNLDTHGVASGAALLARQEARRQPAPLILSEPIELAALETELARYAAAWWSLARAAPRLRDDIENTKGSFHG
ncbi:FGGY family carbohydrate kinase [Sinorhizobium numidicum]|uniref:FGGY family carbohydrate kinase n=1 Tax=Sinorhizobium numidicum TaxID=680248 RepID=A0ABY8CST9_9HYPH|nr:FGGY family carbohydrate kinase [Sinorhizobium numidicum]WEX75657.1 FGGY family carbohydrate kinase [Sinorhizobium numidicum]WEX81654.1 FGGY family carbohydrate kinase [Sinorhizobium numidicum]